MLDDVTAKLGGKPLDLFVMTHEHLDHVQGFLHASEKLNKSDQGEAGLADRLRGT